ncbi:MAG: peptidylprolyl isomerase [Ignavibacteria bacterium]|jgi:peptidyl-prolyl cis-trans isomerase SurA|nr:peptidylprolyl isomerase [Ignavibacteria bacterium]
MKNYLMKYIANSISAFALFIAISICCYSQTFELHNGDVIDKIVAVVGNEIILQSDIDAYILSQMMNNDKINYNDKEMRRTLLLSFIEEKILIVKALEDTITVSDELVDERMNMMIQQLIQVYGSVDRIEAIYKKTLNRLKTEAREDVKKRLIAQQLENKKFGNIDVTQSEISEFYNKYLDSLPIIPELVEIYHIVKYIEPDSTDKLNTIAFAKSIRDSIIKGGDFADFAKRYSNDAGSAADGGDLGWVEKGKFVSEFERAAIGLQPNEISMPIESPFGYHVIKLIAKNKDSINASHILFKLVQSDDNIEKARNTLDSIRTIALASGNFAELAASLSDEKETKGFGGLIGKTPLEQMPPLFSVAKELKDGEISTPIPYSPDPTKQGFHIVLRKRTIPEHKANITDDYDYLKETTTKFKMADERKKWVEQLKGEIYWELFD